MVDEEVFIKGICLGLEFPIRQLFRLYEDTCSGDLEAEQRVIQFLQSEAKKMGIIRRKRKSRPSHPSQNRTTLG